jgi:ubiquitin carboxyl-terminal hydrolase 7
MAKLINMADEAMRDLVLVPLIEQPEIIAEGHHTWHIEQWRGSKRRDHGPVFEVGGFPW